MQSLLLILVNFNKNAIQKMRVFLLVKQVLTVLEFLLHRISKSYFMMANRPMYSVN